jgi:hypothetical protein
VNGGAWDGEGVTLDLVSCEGMEMGVEDKERAGEGVVGVHRVVAVGGALDFRDP